MIRKLKATNHYKHRITKISLEKPTVYCFTDASFANKTDVNDTAGISLGDPGENAGPRGDHFLNSNNATQELNEVRKKIANINAPSVNPPEYDNKEEGGLV